MHNGGKSVTEMVFAILRSAAILAMAFGVYGLLVQAIESYYRFDPSYLGPFILSRFVRPLIAVSMAILLWRLARPLARMASR